jgi:hypothetical protein
MGLLKKNKVVILGSCVTRDIFRVFPEGIDIIDYYARTCVPSMVSKPLDIEDDEVNLESQFQKRMVLRDIRKLFWSEIGNKEFDYLLLDLVDERFDMVQIGESKINMTGELNHSGFLKNRPYMRISRSKYDISTWEKECEQFVDMLTSKVETEKIAIVRARWATEYRDENGITVEMDTKNLQVANECNRIIGGYYGIIQDLLPTCPVVQSDHTIGDKKHVWGLAPIHYIDDWYKDCRFQIDQILSKI